MTTPERHLLDEFVITASDVLFEGIQDKLGVTDGGLCSMVWVGSPTFDATIEAIETKAPGFKATEDEAFSHRMPKLTTQPDNEDASLRATATEFLGHLGEKVGADLTTGGLVERYVEALQGYIVSEQELAAGNSPSM